MPQSPPITSPSNARLTERLEQQRHRIDGKLTELLPGEDAPPSSIHRAMRYSLFAGGKRLRPALCLETSRMLADQPNPDMESIACTLELVHTYSLIHDDLPALDNDDFRRGKPTCHKVFGEAIAILAGDALLTLAFRVLSTLPESSADVCAALVAELSEAAGTVNGMIGGQVADLEAASESVTEHGLEYIHRSKTAALFRASVVMGGIAERAEPTQLSRLAHFGMTAGLAFQIVDDILDVESSTAALGKTAGKDAAQKKVTYPSFYGVERSRRMAQECLADAKSALDSFGDRAGILRDLADRLVFRTA
jgi:geranylgeranyl diphosphate synthase type II